MDQSDEQNEQIIKKRKKTKDKYKNKFKFKPTCTQQRCPGNRVAESFNVQLG